MSARSSFRRRDPFWEVDGPAARLAARKRRARGALAFGASLVAVAAAAFAWTIELGLAAALGIRLTLPIG